MKKIGLIGGTGPESTLVYYKEINTICNQKCGGNAFPEMAVESLNLFKALELVKDNKLDELADYIAGKIDSLVRGGAEIVALTAATMHVVYERLKPKVSVPFISIPETVADEAAARGYKKIGLLGTIFTMEQDYLKKPVEMRGVQVSVPSTEDRKTVNNIISGELEFGVVKPESVEKLVGVINRMKAEYGIEAVILGCTELPLALNGKNCPVPPLDIMQLHIEKLCNLISD
ncbi:MAG: amino acid racemase [Spirochaetaceae bacterium]|nr:amino acid racemase [Spirochaetaceae bacterium]